MMSNNLTLQAGPTRLWLQGHFVSEFRASVHTFMRARGKGTSGSSGRRHLGECGISYPPTAHGNVKGNAMPKYYGTNCSVIFVPVVMLTSPNAANTEA